MMGVTHATSGAAAWIAVTGTMPLLVTELHPLDPVAVIVGSFVCSGAALLPDADHHSATISHSVPVLGRLATGVVGSVSGGHRHGAHSLVGAVIVGFLAWALTLLTLTTDHLGTFSIGTALGAAALVCFAVKARAVVRSWSAAWMLGGIVGLAVVLLAPGSVEWFPVAVVLGFLAHLVGDLLTTGGLPGLLWPIKPRPPRRLRRTPVLNRIWLPNGYIAVPLLGNAGSIREAVLGIVLAAYVFAGLGYESFRAFGVDVTALF
ncbi:metal-dependent hydrolase [Plantibacter sp. YIM 135249]|uniref:metal-dependent hydrolase n=1 Tax=Plantibacter sp. YIM 135249 TaxID=3423918 RepID=UPI003D358203